MDEMVGAGGVLGGAIVEPRVEVALFGDPPSRRTTRCIPTLAGLVYACSARAEGKSEYAETS